MSFRNRCTVAGPNGAVHLSIPLVHGRSQHALMKDVRIADHERWQLRHWKTLTSCYNRSPWFDFYRDELETLFSRKTEFLVDWNMTCFEWVASKLPIYATAMLSDEYQPHKNDLLYLDWRNHLLPASINQRFPDAARYPQVFEERSGFIPNLSILDRLFCMGPDQQ